MRTILWAGAVCLVALCATGARADTTYTLALTANPGSNYNGSGSFSLNVAPSTAAGSVTDYYAAGNPLNTGNTLDALALTVDGVTFGTANENATYPGPSLEFTSGMLTGLTYNGDVFSSPGLYALSSSGLNYSFVNLLGFQNGTGVIRVTSPTGVTPEPSGFLLLGTGCLAGIAALRRRLA